MMIPIAILINVKDNTQAARVDQALKILTTQIGAEDLIKFSAAVQKKPGLVKQALKFV